MHEIVHSLHKSKELVVIIKLDYEKAYANIDFLIEILSVEVLGMSGVNGLG
jgi:hypothetical protein